MDHFDHDKLDVYHAAIDFVAVADDIVERLPRGRRYLADQLQRAATSVSNLPKDQVSSADRYIAEGAGEFSAKEKARFYRMARRSATECAAILDVCHRLELSTPARLQAGRALLLRIVSMLVQMVRSVPRPGTGHGMAGTGTASGTGTG